MKKQYYNCTFPIKTPLENYTFPFIDSIEAIFYQEILFYNAISFLSKATPSQPIFSTESPILSSIDDDFAV